MVSTIDRRKLFEDQGALHPARPKIPVAPGPGRYWVFNRKWVTRADLVEVLQTMQDKRTLVEMAYEVGLWYIDRDEFTKLLAESGVRCLPPPPYQNENRTGPKERMIAQ